MKNKTFSRRMTWASSLGCIACCVLAIAWADPVEPQYDDITLTKVMFSCIRGEFEGIDADANGYISPDEWSDENGNGQYDFEMMTLAEIAPFAEAFYDAYGPLYYADDHPTNPGEAIPWASFTAEQKGKYVRRQMRKYVIAVLRGAEIPAATNAAKATAEAAVATTAGLFPEIED